jgi:hypothetical protein
VAHSTKIDLPAKIKKQIKNNWTGKLGLIKAKNLVVNFKKDTGTLPIMSHTPFRCIYRAIRRDNWAEFGIHEWDDFIKFSNAETQAKADF